MVGVYQSCSLDLDFTAIEPFSLNSLFLDAKYSIILRLCQDFLLMATVFDWKVTNWNKNQVFA